jgi:Subtilase family
MIGRKHRIIAVLAVVIVGTPAFGAAPGADAPSPDKDLNGFMRDVVGMLCTPGDGGPLGLTGKLGAILVDGVRPIRIGDNTVGWRARYRLRSGDELYARQQGLDEKVQTLTMDYYKKMPLSGELAPLMTVVANADCKIVNGRQIRYDDNEHQDRLIFFGPDLEAMAQNEPLNPPVPKGRDVYGPTVALFDAGINYTLPKLAERMARAPNGQSLGYDFWDMDSRPFDSNPARSPFYPLRHGTQVASVVVDEAPGVRLLPYRYPRPDMSRMEAMVHAADENNAVIVAMPMGSNNKDDWSAFLKAVSERPNMLFIISAGNDGRDIDAQPVYPAMFGLENFLVVTSSTEFGRLAPGSNWGKKAVDIMVPAENVPVTTFYGDKSRASGSSLAVARVAALAARLLQDNPKWRGPELKAAILARAQPTPSEGQSVVRHGWIPDPASIN